MKAQTAHDYMDALFTTRRENLRAVATSHGGTLKLAAALGIQNTRMSQLLNRTYGEQVARKIEEKLNLEFGILDLPPAKTKRAAAAPRKAK